jgi:hypothetical protein
MSVNPEMIHTEQCASAFRRMFWAFPFFLDLRVGINEVHVDLLPDFVGWALIASALTWILPLAPIVAGLRTLAYWLVFLAIFDLVEIRIPLRQAGNVTMWITPTFPIGIIAAILDMLFIWRLCGLIIEMASVTRNATIREKADFRRRFYVAFIILAVVAVAISFAVPSFVLVALIVALPLAIIVFCLMMGLMKGTEKMCRGRPV